MFYNSRPVFQSNTVLSSELLQESSDYAAEMFSHIYGAYSDGVIAGAYVTAEGACITVHPGVVKYQGTLYHMPSEVRLSCTVTGCPAYLKLRFHDEVSEEGRMVKTSELVLTEEEASFPYEMELGRFILEKGARLCSDYKNFEDMATQYNRLNIIHVPYAGEGKSTISPRITKQFGKELLARDTGELYDTAFAFACLNGGTVNRDVICLYLERALGPGAYEAYENNEIYQAFLRLLKRAGKPLRRSLQGAGQRKVIVD